MSETPDATVPAEPASALDFDAWLATGTTGQATVVLHNARHIPDLLAQLERRHAIAKKASADPDASVSDDFGLAAIEAEYEELWTAWEASKETWVIRAASDDEVQAINRAHEAPHMPDEPKAPGKNSPEPVKARYVAEKASYDEALEAWRPAAVEYQDEVNLHYLVSMIIRVETAAGVALPQGDLLTVDGELNPGFRPAVTVEQIRALRRMPGRQDDVPALLAAAVKARKGDVQPAVPFSQRASENARI